MRISLSYFYQIRFFRPYMIPLSTALWDPKWYHKSTGNQYTKFIDKNGVINGLRIECLQPHSESESKSDDHKYCTYCTEDDKKINSQHHDCDFLLDYRSKLDRLDFNKLLNDFDVIGQSIKNQLNFTQDPLIVLIVHESPDNPCSERWVLFDYFRDHNYPLYELQYPILSNY